MHVNGAVVAACAKKCPEKASVLSRITENITFVGAWYLPILGIDQRVILGMPSLGSPLGASKGLDYLLYTFGIRSDHNPRT